ncbi:unnamed protein product [Linum trigynum]|uniref:CBF1-interacting co-repressor CIR N-terminal domain-containing protein n=1 Tax=Linum trigynum TaxID=586398 RepID=A0AAV2C7L3_9ROSI
MALKFLNKKGWHTGSLRNIENVWKAEQKHDAEQKKLEELKKQIQEERERSEFRQLQEEAGLVPRQERLEFLYDSGLSVGKVSASSSSGAGVAFKELEEALPGGSKTSEGVVPPSSSSAAAAPGALFEDKPHSANDAWRKLHSDPLLMIRQREQEAIARIKNNPVQMALIRKSVQADGENEKCRDKKELGKKHRHGDGKHSRRSSSKQKPDSEDEDDETDRVRKRNSNKHKSSKKHEDPALDGESNGRESWRSRNDSSRGLRDRNHSTPGRFSDRNQREEQDYERPKSDNKRYSDDRPVQRERVDHDSYRNKWRNRAPKLSEEERAAKLREMQMDAEIHEARRWKRLKKAEEEDVKEDTRAKQSHSVKNFLDVAQKSVYGAEKGGSTTIEESVRRRAYYSQGRSEASSGNAFRR